MLSDRRIVHGTENACHRARKNPLQHGRDISLSSAGAALRSNQNIFTSEKSLTFPYLGLLHCAGSVTQMRKWFDFVGYSL
jgi:hypothetical protein